MNRVFLGMPTYSATVHMQPFRVFLTAASKRGSVAKWKTQTSSLLCKSFNLLWAEALNDFDAGLIRYFVMQHADVMPENGYVDQLIDLIQWHNADVVSVVLPVKSHEGFTSTAIDGKDKFHPLRRITMRELQSMPGTFEASEGETLLINTGCFIADLAKPWSRGVCFSIDDIIECVDGEYRVGVAPEDWQFSRYLAGQDAKVMATTEVEAIHFGETGYSNRGVWGHEHDTAGASNGKATEATI